MIASDPQSKPSLQRLSMVFALYAAIGGLVSFLGWALDIPRLAGWDNTGIYILPNTTVAAMAAAAASILLLYQYRVAAGFLGGLVLLIGSTVIFEFRTGIDLGIDRLLMFGHTWGNAGVAFPGRMGPPAATSWSMIGAALVLIATSSTFAAEARKRARVAALTLTFIALGVSLLSLIGYFYGARTLYTLPTLTIIAFQTATFILAVSLSMVLVLRDIEPVALFYDPGPAGVLARRVVPAVILVPFLLGWLRLEGERAGMFDLAFGTAARTVIEIVLFLILLASVARAVQKQSGLAAERSEAARQSDRNFQQMAEAMPQVVWIADNSGHVHYFNQRVSTFAGVVRFPDGTFDWRPVIHPDDVEETQDCWEQAVAEKKIYGTEHRILSSDGTYRWHLSRAVPMLGPDGEVEKWYGTATDIHDLKCAEEELQAINEDLENRVADRTGALAAANRSLVLEMAEREAAEEEKLLLLRRLVNSQEVERSRIARDLHDQLGQRLTALRLKIESLNDLSGTDAELTGRIAELQEICEKLDDEASFLAWELRPAALDDLGLVEALSTYVSEWSRHHSTRAEFHASNPPTGLSPDTKTHLYRIAQEALNNIAKYAKADHVTVMLERRGSGILMIIEDNGVGFDVATLNRHDEPRPGLGIRGMRERAALVGGEIEIESSGSGTTVYARIAGAEANASEAAVTIDPAPSIVT